MKAEFNFNRNFPTFTPQSSCSTKPFLAPRGSRYEVRERNFRSVDDAPHQLQNIQLFVPLLKPLYYDFGMQQSSARTMPGRPDDDPCASPHDAKSQLRKTMGFWDVLLFNIATVLGPRWIAAAGHNGTSSISLWVLAAVFFFVPGALVINELSSRFPEEGGLYVWSREAFGAFHGFIAGWTYWIYTVFYFPGLLLASASMGAYIMGGRGAALAQNRTFLLSVSLAHAAGRRGAEHHRPEHRQMAAERGRRGHLFAAADAGAWSPWPSACATARPRTSRSPT